MSPPANSLTPPRPRIGVGVFVVRRRQTPPPTNSDTTTTTTTLTAPPTANSLEFIIGQRLGSHGSGTWALPGGHLEFNESFETCATREILEETGIAVTNVRFLTATNDVMLDEGKHYVTVFVVAEVDEESEVKEPEILEPQKCMGWEWVGWETVVGWVERGEESRRLFLPLVNLVKQRPGVVPMLY